MGVNIRFISDLDFQLKAISSIVNLFDGALAEIKEQIHFGINSNPKIISLDTINKNLERIQAQNKLSVTKVASLEGVDIYDRPNFSVEMETGTGKTYIFLRSVLELNKRYGLKKFVVVVPSVAIREGILANLKLTKPHFQKIYDRVPYNFRVFSSDRMTDLSTFCRSNELEILVITIQSFNKADINTLYEKGRDDILIADSGMDMLAQTSPVLILDEPHKMGSELSASAINNLNPLFVLRYSATHRDLDKTNLVYSLGPAEAHDLGLVKKIDVIGATVKHESSLPFIKLVGVVLKPKIKAKVVLKIKTEKGVTEKAVMLSKGDSLREKSKNPAYENVIVTNISGAEDNTYLELTGGVRVKLNGSQGDTYLLVAKEQIEETIKVHFEKQEKLGKQGIKVLSLFFIDEVSDYQELDQSKEGGFEEIARIEPEKYLFVRRTFDEVFERLKKEHPDWKNKNAEEVRGAYFSARKTFKSISQDKEKIDEILSDKEKLLSFESPTAFVFTHSALGEGWDNPNVFNICTLRITHSEITKRQTIGRGLRIPVTQQGTRFENTSENILTVIANESYEDFAKTLQTDYQEDGIMHTPPIENRRDKITAKLKTAVFKGEFKEIWDKLKLKTEFSSEIRTEDLVNECKKALAENLIVRKPIIDVRRAKIEFTQKGIETIEKESEPIKDIEVAYSIPDIVTRISNETGLTRKTIARVLVESGKLRDIFNNPEEFVSKAATIIKEKKIKMEIKTATYHKTKEAYLDSIFGAEVSSYKTNVVESERSVYDKVLCDNPSERTFAQDMTKDEQVNVFCKLPQNYYIQTPTGPYRPDWAVIFQRARVADSGRIENKLYLVRETKFGYSDIRGIRKSVPEDEQDKIDCAEKHFKEISGIDFKWVSSYDDFKEKLPA
ncbi:Type III restriction enzyme, res subunit [Candidatus Gugararchaeum adminiculabundum]|nr:Type III restriction enzyme, res subunit [Candidatus Gugararchaeum adminiculabundum]